MAAPQDIKHYLREGTLTLSALPPLSLYIHIPWCLKKCPYCDFNSHSIGEKHGITAQLEQNYVQALLTDLQSCLPLIWGRTVHSIFFGGGTPSLFSPTAIEQIINGARALLNLQADCEITLEANPGTFEKDRFKAFKQAGVNRLSIGVQSFNNTCLKAIGRIHSAEQALAAAQEAANCFSNFNLDLMYALPKQNLAMLEQDLQQIIALNPSHLSLYHLSIEPNTLFAKYPPQVPTDDQAFSMLDFLIQHTKQAGFTRYEVSAYASSASHQAKHNLNYWQFGDYLGIGAGAHSKISFAHRVIRQVRYREPNKYLQQASQGQAISQEYEIKRPDLAFEFMLNALRLVDGFALNLYTERTGLPITSIAKPLEQAEKLGLITRDLTWLQPTSKGLDFLTDLQSLFLPD